MPTNPSIKKLSTLSLVAVIFFTISGGPYGLEPLLSYCSGKQSIILLIVVPILWDIPIILTVLELNGMMPKIGGYYLWIKHALGLRWAFYEGWWSWLTTFIDLAIYPQLFIMYASLLFPEIAPYRIPMCILIVWMGAIINILGIVQVGRTSIVLGILVLVPFIVMFFLGSSHLYFNGLQKTTSSPSYFGLAIFTIIWNYIGWDNVTTYAEEVQKPTTSYLKGISSAFVLIFCMYILVTVIAVNSGIPISDLKNNGYPVLAQKIGGKWLSTFVAIGGMISSIGIFLAVLLSIARVPEKMSIDKLLPQKICALHPRFGTPYLSILLCAIVVTFLVAFTFDKLLIVDISMYFLGMTLEFLSLIVLRIREPNILRPFKIPLNTIGLCVMLLIPTTIYLIAFTDILMKEEDALKAFGLVFLLIISAHVAWRFAQRNLQKKQY